MIPTEEEISLIQDARQESASAPLGFAEQFLLTLSSISELEARLNLWSFKVDYETLEKVKAYYMFVEQFINFKVITGVCCCWRVST